MEVHTHSHTPGKKWTHYFWEFFMLFLAVTLGFFVENQREHMLEHQREKQFIQSLVNDIKTDTARLNTLINNRIAKEHRMDSLTFLLNSPSAGNFTNDIYFYAVTVARTNTIRFIPNDGTMQQLKNSGALRLIRTRAVADSIAKYDVSTRFLLRQGELEETLIDNYREAASKIFNSLIYEQMLDSNNVPTRLPPGDPALLPNYQAYLSDWNYKMFSVKGLNKGIRRDARLFLQQAINLLATLKKEYGLE
jgi:hypothetical protein